MKRRFRLRSATEFKRVRLTGKSFAHPLVVLVVAPQVENLQIGISAGKSVGSAVDRNRAKRRLRAAVNHWLPQLSTGNHLIFIARRPCVEAEWPELLNAVQSLLKRACLFRDVQE